MNTSFCCINLKDWEKLVEEAEKAVVMFPLEPLFNQYKGIGYEELEDHKNAVKAFKAGLAVIYDMPRAWEFDCFELSYVLPRTG